LDSRHKLMQRNEHKRVKHGQKPGDIHKGLKIAMREGRTPIVLRYWVITTKAAKTYNRMLKKKGRAVQRRRDKQRIGEELEH